MPYAITLTLDDKSSAKVRKLWRKIDDSGLAKSVTGLNYAPHVTLARHVELDPLATADVLDSFAAGLPAVTVLIDRLAAFERPTPVLFLGITESPELRAFHARLTPLIVGTGADAHTAETISWVPHVTLTTGMPKGQKRTDLEQLVAHEFSAFEARLAGLELVRFPPVAILNSAVLGGRQTATRLQ
jgi:2'-5' RNA ligase